MPLLSLFPFTSMMSRQQITVIVYILSVCCCNAVPLLDDEYSCNVCRDPPHGERYLINPNKSFTQSDGRVTTCGELQQWVQDVQPVIFFDPSSSFLLYYIIQGYVTLSPLISLLYFALSCFISLSFVRVLVRWKPRRS